jgi:hypothetical protein
MKPVGLVTIRTLTLIAKNLVNPTTTITLRTVTTLSVRNMKSTVDAGEMRMIIVRGTMKATVRNRMRTTEGAKQAKAMAPAMTLTVEDSSRVKATPPHMNGLIATDKASVTVVRVENMGTGSVMVIKMKNIEAAKAENMEIQNDMVIEVKNMETGVTAAKAKNMETGSVMVGVKNMKTDRAIVVRMKDSATMKVTVVAAKVMVDLREDMKGPVMIPGQATTATVVMKPLVPNVSTSMRVTMITEKEGMDMATTTIASIQMTE